MALAPSKKTNVLFLEKLAPSRVTNPRVCCEDSAQRKTNKMASEITFVADEEIQFLSSVSLPTCGKPLGRTFWIVTLNTTIMQVILMMAVRIFWTNPVAKMRRTCRTRISPFDWYNVLPAKKTLNYEKQLKANQAGKGKRHPENAFSLRTYRDWGAAAKTVKSMSKHGANKSDALLNHCHFFHCKRK